VCGVDSIERQIQSNALWWGGREVYVAEKYMAELMQVQAQVLRHGKPVTTYARLSALIHDIETPLYSFIIYSLECA
jgi:hypothetical protein